MLVAAPSIAAAGIVLYGSGSDRTPISEWFSYAAAGTGPEEAMFSAARRLTTRVDSPIYQP
jgi:hypothetical protein